MSKKNFFADTPSLFIQTGEDKSQLFGLNFARECRHFVLRGTGGCGLMSESDAIGLRNLRLALSGQADDGSTHERFSGYCLFGGTRMLRKDDPTHVVPGITEVFPAISKYCPESTLLGVIVKAGHLRHTPYGIVVHDDPKNPEYITIVHPTQTSSVILQPSSDSTASWDDEWKECVRICDSLRNAKWKGLLLAYNGGGVTEKEVRTWAKLGQTDPFWQVLLVKGSGRKCDELANDEDFLAEHPTVHVCENNVEDMRRKLIELEAIISPDEIKPKP